MVVYKEWSFIRNVWKTMCMHCMWLLYFDATLTAGVLSRQVRSFGGESRQLGAFEGQVAASQASGTQLGWLKSYNEAWTRIAVYVSLLAVYWLGGAKVKAVRGKNRCPFAHTQAFTSKSLFPFVGMRWFTLFLEKGLILWFRDFVISWFFGFVIF